MKNIFPKVMNRILLTTMALLCCYGCKEEADFDFVYPSILLEGAEVVAPDEGELKVTVKMGAGFKEHKAWVQMKDISSDAGQGSVLPVTLTEEEVQKHLLNVRPPVSGHDYQVMAVLETSKNRWESDKFFLFFSQKTHRYDVGNPYIIRSSINKDVSFLEGEVYAICERGGTFAVSLDNDAGFTVEEVEMTLNGTIRLDCHYNKVVYNPNETVTGTLPDDLPTGDYTVQVYVDGEKWDVEGLVRVLPWKSEMIELPGKHEYSYFSISTSFVFDDEVVYVQNLERNYVESYTEFKVWSYRISTGEWDAKSNWIPTDDGNPLQGVAMGETGYSLVRHGYRVALWSYLPETDEWMRLSDYPGKGIGGHLIFAANGYVYIGGGVSQKDLQDKQVGVNDFWRYDVQTKQWEQLDDLPFEIPAYDSINSACSDGNKAYAFLYDRTLWSYDLPTARWSQEETLMQGPYFRYWAPICMWEGNVCLIGGEFDFHNQFTDIQLYDPETREWTLKEIYRFTSHMSSSYIPAIHQHNGSIFVGPFEQMSSNVYDPIPPQFLKIIPQ